METRAHTQTCPPQRVLALLALLLALTVVAACLAAGAAARPAHARHAPSCGASRHARHAGTRHCAHHGKGAHKSRKPAPKPAPPAPSLTPARCEDGTAPVREASGPYTCEDDSEPVCADGSAPTQTSASSAPMCRASHEAAIPECGLGSKVECGPELACEEEATEGAQGCEHGSAFEEEEPEA